MVTNHTGLVTTLVGRSLDFITTIVFNLIISFTIS